MDKESESFLAPFFLSLFPIPRSPFMPRNIVACIWEGGGEGEGRGGGREGEGRWEREEGGRDGYSTLLKHILLHAWRIDSIHNIHIQWNLLIRDTLVHRPLSLIRRLSPIGRFGIKLSFYALLQHQ